MCASMASICKPCCACRNMRRKRWRNCCWKAVQFVWPGCWKRAPVALWLPCLPPRLRAAAEQHSVLQAGEAAAAALAQFARRCSAYAFGPEALLAFLLRLELRRRGVRMSAALRKVLPAEEVKKRLEVYDG